MEPRPPDLSAAGTSDLSVTAGTGPWEGSKGRGRPRLKPGSRKNKPPTRLFGMAEPDSSPTPDDPRNQPPIDPNSLLGRLPFPRPRLQPGSPHLFDTDASDLSATRDSSSVGEAGRELEQSGKVVDGVAEVGRGDGEAARAGQRGESLEERRVLVPLHALPLGEDAQLAQRIAGLGNARLGRERLGVEQLAPARERAVEHEAFEGKGAREDLVPEVERLAHRRLGGASE